MNRFLHFWTHLIAYFLAKLFMKKMRDNEFFTFMKNHDFFINLSEGPQHKASSKLQQYYWRHAVNCQPGSRVMSSKHRAPKHTQSLIISLKTYTWMNFLLINSFNTQQYEFFKNFNFLIHFLMTFTNFFDIAFSVYFNVKYNFSALR